jgi:hypothetical protein
MVSAQLWRSVVVLGSVAVVLVASKATDDNDDSMGTFMWDLNVDPIEANSVYGEAAYGTQQAALYDLIGEYQKLAGTCDNTYTNLANEEAAYDVCGGVCANVTENFYSLEVEQVYNAASPPHIVFVLADDWGYNDVGFRSTYMDWTTPTIDSYVSEGITIENYFTHYYCAPSRAALMTGRYAARLGMIDENEGCELPLSETTMAQEMKSAGYRTYMVGKWHLGYVSNDTICLLC